MHDHEHRHLDGTVHSHPHAEGREGMCHNHPAEGSEPYLASASELVADDLNEVWVDIGGEG